MTLPARIPFYAIQCLPRTRFAWFLFGALALALLGCGPVQTVGSINSTRHPPTLPPTSVVGTAISVMQVGDETLLTTWRGNAIDLTILRRDRKQQVVLPVHEFCTSAGYLVRLPPVIGVTGCGSVWIDHASHWLHVVLPTRLSTGESVTGRGSQWWTVGIVGTASGMGSEAVKVWTTTTLGASWDLGAQSHNALSSRPRGSIPYFGAKSGIEAGPGHHLWLSGSGGGGFWMYRSAAGLQTWTAVTAQSPKPGPNSWVTGSDALVETSPPLFTSRTEGYIPATVFGPQDRLAIFAVTGPTWRIAQLRGLLPLAPQSVWSLAASGSHTLWVAASRRLYRSASGGRTWQVAGSIPYPWTFLAISFSGSYGSVLAILPPGAHHPGHYALWRTTTDGKTWRAVRVSRRNASWDRDTTP